MPEVRAIFARNYSLHYTFHADATILDELLASRKQCDCWPNISIPLNRDSNVMATPTRADVFAAIAMGVPNSWHLWFK